MLKMAKLLIYISKNFQNFIFQLYLYQDFQSLLGNRRTTLYLVHFIREVLLKKYLYTAIECTLEF